ncbi:two-component sensor histidine kinase [Agrobacterium sp. ICMP 6402]|nr:two-component sensor histidine kinase [Agrobacterium sp. ICMP 6402]
MRSIRLRLFVILLASTGAVWLLAVLWTYFSVQHQVEKVLDARLTEAARMVSSLITDHHIDVAAAVNAATATDVPLSFETEQGDYRRQLSCQIWSLEGQLVSRSESAPRISLSDHQDGFSETLVDGARWRVYAVVNPTLNVRVLVGDSLEIRDRLVADVVKGQLFPAVAILPVLALLIWLSVAQGLRPLNRIASLIAGRSADELHAIGETKAPSEIKPLLTSLNSLFRRVEEARDREKTFIAYAAHELKTPLAGLKTQAQVALRSEDKNVRAKALSQISKSVDRTGRLVRQLIDMASVDSADRRSDLEAVNFPLMFAELITDLDSLCSRAKVAVIVNELNVGELRVRNANLLRLALRNVVENAVQSSPPNTVVLINSRINGENVELEIIDHGAGIDPTELTKVRERFKRGHAAAGEGSGLGLAIVDMAMLKLGGGLNFKRVSDGFAAVLALPLERSDADA